MRELEFREYVSEVEECQKELECTIKSILKKKGESVPYNFIHMVENSLIKGGVYELNNLTLKYNSEKVLVHDKCEKVEFKEYADDVKIINENNGVYNLTFTGYINKLVIDGEGVLFEILTIGEAAQIWGINENNIRKDIKKTKFKFGIDFRKAGKIILIEKKAMIRVYGEPKNK